VRKGIMRLRNTIAASSLGLLAIGSLSGCASSPPPRELLDARAVYARAKQGPASHLTPASLHEAKVALDKAERAYSDEPESATTQDLAYIAERKAQLSETEAAAMASKQTADQAVAMAKEAQSNAAQSTQGQLNQARQQLSTMGEQAEGDRAAREEAERIAQEAIQKYAAAHADMIKMEGRGVVITVPGEVLFGVGKSTLHPAAQARLDEVALALKGQEGHEITVEGYTDSQGAEDMNQRLSETRAESVKKYLVSKGVPEERVRAEGRGEESPIASNDTVSGRAANRRVEIVVRPTEQQQQQQGLKQQP